MVGVRRWRSGSSCSSCKQTGRQPPIAAQLLLLLLLGTAFHAPAAAASRLLTRRLLQAPAVTATSQTPVTINSGEPAVTAQSGLVLSELLQKALEKKAAVPPPAPAPVATIVVPPPQTAALPTTTTGGIQLATSTPVTVSSPVNVTTPVQQKSVQLASGKSSDSITDGLNTYINLANLFANVLGAGGAIAGAIPAWIDTFLPDCPPGGPGVGGPVIPGCAILAGNFSALLPGFPAFPGFSAFPGLSNPGRGGSPAAGGGAGAARPAAGGAGRRPATPPGDRNLR